MIENRIGDLDTGDIDPRVGGLLIVLSHVEISRFTSLNFGDL